MPALPGTRIGVSFGGTFRGGERCEAAAAAATGVPAAALAVVASAAALVLTLRWNGVRSWIALLQTRSAELRALEPDILGTIIGSKAMV